MTIDFIEKISYQEKKMLVAQACLLFKKIRVYKSVIENKIQNSQQLNDSRKEDLLNLRISSIFETVLSLLKKEYKLIIEKDFINIDENATWYLDFWSKSTYYKLKHQALNQFLFILYV